jgi:hypothetical protein
MSAERLRPGLRRRARSLRQRLLRAGLLALALAAPAALAYGALQLKDRLRLDERFPLRSWSVVGADRADEARLRRLLDGQIGQPLGRIDAAGLERELAEDPWILAARVVPLWPKGLRVEVDEAAPVAWLRQPGGLACLDGEGRLLPLPAGGSPLDLPLLEGVEDAAGVDPRARLADAAQALDWMRRQHGVLWARLERLHWGPEPRLLLGGPAPELRLRRESWRHGLSLVEAVRAGQPELLEQPGRLDLRFTNQVIRRRSDV